MFQLLYILLYFFACPCACLDFTACFGTPLYMLPGTLLCTVAYKYITILHLIITNPSSFLVICACCPTAPSPGIPRIQQVMGPANQVSGQKNHNLHKHYSIIPITVSFSLILLTQCICTLRSVLGPHKPCMRCTMEPGVVEVH